MTTTPRTATALNPWTRALWVATALTALIGVPLTGTNSDPLVDGYNPAAAELGNTLLVVAGVLLAAALLAGAINWQLRR